MNDELRKIYERVLAFSPDEPDSPFPFSARLARENRWSPAFARRVIEEYKKFAFLSVAAGHPVTPSDAVDQAWHLHLTYTRSYWEDFCPKVLGRPLHHHPTPGGARERAKFDAGYRRTLDSYQRLFGTAPPADIWPAPEIRFRPVHFVRVDARRHWLVPRPAGLTQVFARSSSLAAGLSLLPLVLASCRDAGDAIGFLSSTVFLGLGLYIIAGLAVAFLTSLMPGRGWGGDEDGGSGGGDGGGCGGCGGGCGG